MLKAVVFRRLRKCAQRLCRKSSIIPGTNPKPGKHLESSHPSLQYLRTWITMEVKKKNISPQLIANFDQVWSVQYRPRKSILQHKGAYDEHSRSTCKRRIRHRLERVLGLPFTEASASTDTDPAPPTLQGGKAATGVVDLWRMPRTVTTLSWIDGTAGRSFITCRDNCLSEKQRIQINEVGPPVSLSLFPFPLYTSGLGVRMRH